MNADGRERRKYIRVFFPTEKAITGTQIIPGAENRSVSAGILNLSEEGVCLVLERELLKGDKTIKIYKGDSLLLDNIVGTTPEIMISKQELKVKWIIDNLYFNHMEIGCQMLNVPDQLRDDIRQTISLMKEQHS
jgi:hypothetical protein